MSDLIVSGYDGFTVESVDEALDVIGALSKDIDLAARVSAAGRASASALFGENRIKVAWANYLGDGRAASRAF